MHYLFFALTLIASIPMNAQPNLEELTKDLAVESIEIKQIDTEYYLQITFTGSEQSFFERSFPYPIIKVELDNGKILEMDMTYLLTKKALVKTDLQYLAEDFHCVVHLNTLHSQQADIQMPYSINKVNDFEITNIEHISKEGQHFLKLTIRDRNPNGAFYSYPLFKIVSNGETIGERGMTTYGLVETELIPTQLTALPKNFECTVFLDNHGNMGLIPHELHYKAKK